LIHILCNPTADPYLTPSITRLRIAPSETTVWEHNMGSLGMPELLIVALIIMIWLTIRASNPNKPV